ncbi:MAG: hypothetical protein R3B70_22000 [Polyangiaceae bacterium]
MSADLSREMTVYELEIFATEVAFEVRVNDQPVLRMPAGKVQTAFDVNPYVEPGENKLSLTVRPRSRGRDFSEHASCKVELRKRPHPDSQSALTLGTLLFSGYGTGAVTGFAQSTPAAGGGPVLVERFGARATMGFVLGDAFGPWSWANADKLSPTEALRAEVLAEYQVIHGLLSRRETSALSSRCALQAADYQRAYYQSTLAEAEQLLGIAQLMNDPSVQVEPFPDSILTLELHGGGRLVELVDADGKSPLRLSSTEAPQMVGRFNCVLCKMDGGYQVVR